jgi:predicted signal transduction protein with EAL and GGDEF domain
LKCADMALYGAKADGRGACRFFESEMNARVEARRRLEVDLRAAIAGKQVEMFYQPIVSVGNNEVIAFEALIRWRHPDRGMISPAEFIPIADFHGRFWYRIFKFELSAKFTLRQDQNRSELRSRARRM